jgi:hypothetical protein
MELRKYSMLSQGERDAVVEELGRKAVAPRNGQAVGIEARVAAFEAQYGMTSDEMRRRFASGEIGDTADTSSWLMLLRSRER